MKQKTGEMATPMMTPVMMVLMLTQTQISVMLVKQKTGEIETFTVMMVIMMMIPMKMMMMLNVETCEKVPHVNVSISCREGEEEQDNHKQGDFTPISGEFRFQKLVAITVIMLIGILYLL